MESFQDETTAIAWLPLPLFLLSFTNYLHDLVSRVEWMWQRWNPHRFLHNSIEWMQLLVAAPLLLVLGLALAHFPFSPSTHVDECFQRRPLGSSFVALVELAFDWTDLCLPVSVLMMLVQTHLLQGLHLCHFVLSLIQPNLSFLHEKIKENITLNFRFVNRLQSLPMPWRSANKKFFKLVWRAIHWFYD